jgi:hypothetical protein
MYPFGMSSRSPDILRLLEAFLNILKQIHRKTHFSRKSKSFASVSVFKNVVTLGISRFLSFEFYADPLNSAKTPLGADILLQSKFISKYE